LAALGKVQVKSLSDAAHGDSWREGIVMIRHPNFTGMQMDIDTRGYTPARYVNVIEVTRGGALVWRMEGGISISENPNIRFTYDGKSGDPIDVRATDTDGTKFAGKSMPSGS
jgi:sulfur-oxidizing protein SoxY